MADSRKPSEDKKSVATKPVSVVKLSGLRKGQQSVYKLIVQKLNTDEAITISEAKNIWLSQVHSDVENGIPYYMDYSVPVKDSQGNHAGWTTQRKAMTHEHILQRSLMWLTSTIGILVIRGYLKVIPQIEIGE